MNDEKTITVFSDDAAAYEWLCEVILEFIDLKPRISSLDEKILNALTAICTEFEYKTFNIKNNLDG